MAYDVGADSIALVEGRLRPTEELRLSRRRRTLPMAVDVVGDDAVAVFARRGVSGQPQIDVNLLHRRAHLWHYLGGGSGPGELTFELPEGWRKLRRAYSPSAAGSAVPGGWIDAAVVLTDGSVGALRLPGGRTLVIGPNRSAALIWRGTAPTLEVLDAAGALLETLPLGARFAPPGWPADAPLPTP